MNNSEATSMSNHNRCHLQFSSILACRETIYISEPLKEIQCIDVYICSKRQWATLALKEYRLLKKSSFKIFWHRWWENAEIIHHKKQWILIMWLLPVKYVYCLFKVQKWPKTTWIRQLPTVTRYVKCTHTNNQFSRARCEEWKNVLKC